MRLLHPLQMRTAMLRAHNVIAAVESAADPATTGGSGAGAGGDTNPLSSKSTFSVITSFW